MLEHFPSAIRINSKLRLVNKAFQALPLPSYPTWSAHLLTNTPTLPPSHLPHFQFFSSRFQALSHTQDFEKPVSFFVQSPWWTLTYPPRPSSYISLSALPSVHISCITLVSYLLSHLSASFPSSLKAGTLLCSSSDAQAQDRTWYKSLNKCPWNVKKKLGMVLSKGWERLWTARGMWQNPTRDKSWAVWSRGTMSTDT